MSEGGSLCAEGQKCANAGQHARQAIMWAPFQPPLDERRDDRRSDAATSGSGGCACVRRVRGCERGAAREDIISLSGGVVVAHRNLNANQNAGTWPGACRCVLEASGSKLTELWLVWSGSGDIGQWTRPTVVGKARLHCRSWSHGVGGMGSRVLATEALGGSGGFEISSGGIDEVESTQKDGQEGGEGWGRGRAGERGAGTGGGGSIERLVAFGVARHEPTAPLVLHTVLHPAAGLPSLLWLASRLWLAC